MRDLLTLARRVWDPIRCHSLVRWFPVSRSEEVLPRRIVQAELLGQEIALWRSDSDSVNAWENRCPHRGVRLSIGCNGGDELICRYHGWRFAAGSGQCTHIPAHPGQKPAATIRAASYACEERSGFVWVNLDPAATPLPSEAPDSDGITTLRSVHVAAAASRIASVLKESYTTGGDDEFILSGPATADSARLTLLLQPMNSSHTVVHGFIHARTSRERRVAILRQHNGRLTALRNSVESAARLGP